jgi:hypothetical protein
MSGQLFRGFVRYTSVAVAAILTLAVSMGDTVEFPPQSTLEEVRVQIEGNSTNHPRLLATKRDFEAMRASVARDPLKHIIRRAETLQEIPPVERIVVGRRLLHTSRKCLERVLTLAMAYHLTGDRQHAERCQEEMLAAARFEDWHPEHFLDVAEMTFALAIGYDWLFDELDEPPRREIRQAIVDKGVGLQFVDRDNWWVTVANNWGQVCHAGMIAGALAVLEDEPGLATRTVHNAVRNVVPAMEQYAPEGGYPEGPQYWSYGTTYNVLLVACLESALGSDFGLSAAPGFDKTGGFLALTCGPTDQFFNYSDGGAKRDPEPILPWFAARYSRPDWLAGERQRWQALLDQRQEESGEPMRFLPLVLLWMSDDEIPAKESLPLNWSSGGQVPITIHRSSWQDKNATFVGLKAGSPSASHGQMDCGSFVLDSDGVRWAIDLDPEEYHAIESRGMNLWDRGQDSDRWKILRLNNHGHNTLVIDDQLQSSSANAPIVAFSDNPAWPFSIVDLGSAYRDQVETARRGVALLPSREVIIRDELIGLNPGARVRWGMVTQGEADKLGSSRVILRHNNQTLALAVADPSARWQVIDISKPDNEFDSPNPRTHMLTLETTAPSSGKVTFAILATPGSCSASIPVATAATPLSGWPPPSALD